MRSRISALLLLAVTAAPLLSSKVSARFQEVPKLANVGNFERITDQILTDYGIAHDFEIYDGDHVNRIGQRLETKVLPFFSTHLKFQ